MIKQQSQAAQQDITELRDIHKLHSEAFGDGVAWTGIRNY